MWHFVKQELKNNPINCSLYDAQSFALREWNVDHQKQLHDSNEQCWESYSVKVIYYLLLFTFEKCNALQLHITSDEK